MWTICAVLLHFVSVVMYYLVSNAQRIIAE